MQLSRLKKAELKTTTKIKQANGSYIETYDLAGEYKLILRELTDEVSSSQYGANLFKTYRVSSPRKRLEKYLQTKVNNTQDNITRYFLFVDNKRYKIISVKNNWVDVELDG